LQEKENKLLGEQAKNLYNDKINKYTEGALGPGARKV